MVSLTFIVSTTNAPNKDSFSYTKINSSSNFTFGIQTLNFQVSSTPRCPLNSHSLCLSTPKPHSHSHSDPQIDGGEEDPEEFVQNLRVPDHWLNNSKALEESEWLRVTLHKWLDDEYCPEATNVEISKVAALSYYESLLDKETDLGEILLKMAIKLERVSFQESFHGAFSSANAAVNLIVQRIEQD